MPIPWLLNSSIGKLRVLLQPSGATSSIFQMDATKRTGDVIEVSLCSTPNYAPKNIVSGAVGNFTILGKSGTQYQVQNRGTSTSPAYYLVANNESMVLWGSVGSSGMQAMSYPVLYYDGVYVGALTSTIYCSNIDSAYSCTITTPQTNRQGYAVITYLRTEIGTYTWSLYNISTTTSNVGKALADIVGGGTPLSTDPYNNLPTPGDDPLPGGGAVGIPGFPGLTATSAGVIGLFCPSAAQMQQLSDFMWTDFGGTGTTVEDILKEVVEALKRTISSPLDYIVGLNIIPSQGLSVGGSKSVRFGFVDSGVTMPLLANQYFTVDCGSLAFDTVCGDTFLDYAPYAKFSIYLPYIGFKDVDPNDFVGHSIGVVYHGDCVTGGVTAYITKDGSVMYQYSGCCALNVPLSADSWGETISGAISVATGIVAAAASGGAAGVGLAAAKGAASVAANPSLLSPQVNHSGAVSGGAGCMGVQHPFVIREAVNFHSTDGFNKESGYPAYYYKALSEVTGFTTVLDPHINNIPQATQGEMSEIISLLESGVIL